MAVVDDLVASDLPHAIVLAQAKEEQTLALADEGPKRKSRWSAAVVPKKGKRWGLMDDKPYKPLTYVDLPDGLSKDEVDQFLREQRLEDLHRKIASFEVEDVDPDIRPPSPPPVFDKSGNRLNARDQRIKKAMAAEYNRLVRYMVKHVEGYSPPADWKPQKLMKKMIIPMDKYPQAPFMGVIIGPRGVNHKRLQETTGCRIFIRGREIGDKWQSDEEAMMPQHIHVEGDTEEQILLAEKLIDPLLNPESAEFEYARTHGMQQLAMVNGFTLSKAEQRCGICGALGHLGFECPETNNNNYKMAEVICTICGDKGHVAMDCKKAAEKHQQENRDWKSQAEKKRAMDQEYINMMNELNQPDGAGATPKAAPGGPTPKAPPPTNVPPRPTGPMAPGPQQPMQPGMHPTTMGGGVQPAGMQPAQPKDGGMQPGVTPPGIKPNPGPVGAVGAPGAPNPILGQPECDGDLLIPVHLVPVLLQDMGAAMRNIGLQTGVKVAVDAGAPLPGGKRILIGGSTDCREQARKALQDWIMQNGGTPGSAMGGGVPQGGMGMGMGMGPKASGNVVPPIRQGMGVPSNIMQQNQPMGMNQPRPMGMQGNQGMMNSGNIMNPNMMQQPSGLSGVPSSGGLPQGLIPGGGGNLSGGLGAPPGGLGGLGGGMPQNQQMQSGMQQNFNPGMGMNHQMNNQFMQ